MITFDDIDGGRTIVDLEHFEPDQEAALLMAAAPHARDSLAGALARLRAEEARLNGVATDEQRAIGWGDHWARCWVPPPEGLALPRTTIYGTVMTLPELRARERATGVSEAEVLAVCARVERDHAAGWRYGECFSRREPRGELGQTHVGTMIPLTGAQFRRARARGWPEKLTEVR